MGSGSDVYYPTTQAPLTTGESAQQYAEALPQIYDAIQKYQPGFDQAAYDSYSQYAPQYAQVNQDAMEAISPYSANMGEVIAQQATQGLENGLPDAMKNMYMNQFKSLTGNQVNAPTGADFASQNLIGQDINYRMQMGQLGAGIASPAQQAFVPQTSYDVGSNFGTALGAQTDAYGSYTAANKPFITPAGGVSLGILGQWGGR